MRVYVVMGNDYPEAVFSTPSAAEAFCRKKKAEREDRRIYWRDYDFVVDEQAVD